MYCVEGRRGKFETSREHWSVRNQPESNVKFEWETSLQWPPTNRQPAAAASMEAKLVKRILISKMWGNGSDWLLPAKRGKNLRNWQVYAINQATPETLQEAERTLSDLLTRKKAVDKTLVRKICPWSPAKEQDWLWWYKMELERKIYLFEGSYLEDTNQYGNIIRGFDGYLNNQSNKKRQKLTEEDRLFSRSSVTYPKVRAQRGMSRCCMKAQTICQGVGDEGAFCPRRHGRRR